jgi:hypothetical protein
MFILIARKPRIKLRGMRSLLDSSETVPQALELTALALIPDMAWSNMPQ